MTYLTIEEAKAVAEILESVATVVALIVGGYWTYQRFVRQRTEIAQGWIRCRASSLASAIGSRLLDVECELGNSGKVLIPIEKVKLIVRQVEPMTDCKALAGRSEGAEYAFPWPEIARREWRWPAGAAEIEPGESQTLSWSFQLMPDLEVVELLGYFEDASSDPKKGWSKRLLVDLTTKRKETPMQRRAYSDNDESNPDTVPKVPDPDQPSGSTC